jgi:hypothetical protein
VISSLSSALSTSPTSKSNQNITDTSTGQFDFTFSRTYTCSTFKIIHFTFTRTLRH